MITKSNEPMVNNSSHVQTGKVYFTEDLKRFVTMSGNRDVNPRHVERITASINTHGLLMNPIIVNSLWEVVDGQHRLEACKTAGTGVHYIVASDYTLSEVHTLNLNQKNWGTKDYLDGYAGMGINKYVRLKEFMEVNDDFTVAISISICSIVTNDGGGSAEQFNTGKWRNRDWEDSQDFVDKLRLVKKYYEGYNRRSFVAALLSLFKNSDFDFNEFMHKVRLQPMALVDCVNLTQYKVLIEDIYNYKNRNKVSFKY